MTWFPR